MTERDTIYHMCRASDWAARTDAGYTGTANDHADGFMHFSGRHQAVRSGRKYYKGVENALLLTVDATQLGDALKWEMAANGQEFPHLYGALPESAVIAVTPLDLGGDGYHVFPADLPEPESPA